MAQESSGTPNNTTKSWTLSSDGYVGAYIQVPTAGSNVSFDLNAAGLVSNGVAPEVTLSVAGTNIPFSVSTASNGDYLANVALPGDANPTNPNGNGTYLVRLQLDNQTATAAPSVSINSLAVTGATVLTSNTSNSDALALDSAQTYADKFRSGPGTITLSNANGIHFGAGTQVQVKLASNAFNFAAEVYGNSPFTNDSQWINVGPNGQNLPATTPEQINYQKAILANFNMIVPANAGKWINNEYTQGSVDMNLVEAMDQFASQNNLGMRMHNLIWNTEQPSFVNNLFSGTPGTLTSANKTTLTNDITSRVNYYLAAKNPNTGTAFADSYAEIDVLNEAWHGQSTKDNYIGSGDLGVSGVANVYAQAAAAVAAAGSNARLYTNEYNVLQFSPQSISATGVATGSDAYANWYLNDIQALQRAGGPVGGVGMELYVNTGNQVSPTQMQEAMGNLSVAKGPDGNPIPLTLSEFGVATGQAPTATTYDADLTTALTMAYGNPQDTTFGYWGGVGGPHDGNGSIYALYDQNYNLTSAGQTWQNWMSQYQTNDTLTTDANGNISFNGTYGMYDVIVNGVTYILDLQPGTTNYGLMTPITTALWNGGGSTNNFSTSGNWGGTALSANAPLVFAGNARLTPNNDSTAGTEYAGVTFNSGSGAFIVGGNAINLAGDVINNSANLQTLNIGLAMQANTNFNAASGDLAVAGNITGAFALTKTGSHALTLTGNNNYSGGTTITAGTLVIATNGALPANSSVAVKGASTMQLASNTGLATLSSLSIDPGARFDITNNHFILSYSGASPVSFIAGYLASGYAGGVWNGPGIDSSSVPANPGYSIGYADGADGVVTGLSSGQIEVEYTLLGDANLDGIVSGADFTILASNLGRGGKSWDQGNFFYDPAGAVTGQDFTALATNLGRQANGADLLVPAADFAALDAFAAANGLMADLPEPASLSLLALAGLGLLGRRRKNVS